MVNEAVNCLYEGLTQPEDIDEVMKLGANHPMGPLALADLIGLDIILNVMETLYQGFEDPKYRPSPLLKQMVDAGYLGRKSGRGFLIIRVLEVVSRTVRHAFRFAAERSAPVEVKTCVHKHSKI